MLFLKRGWPGGWLAGIMLLMSAFAWSAPGEGERLSINTGKVAAAQALRYSSPDQAHLLIEDVLPGGAGKVQWRRNTSKVPNFGFGPMAMWFRLPVENTSSRDLERFIEIQNPVLDEVILYQVRDTDELVSRQVSGDRYPMSERPADHHNLVFSIDIPAGEKHDLYFRVMTDGAMQLPVYIWDPRAFYQADQTRLMGFGMLFGVLVVMALYNLFAYTLLLDRVFLYYALFALNLALFEAAINGFGNQYLWGDSVWWRQHSVVLFIPLLLGFASLYTRSFLQLKLARQWLYNLFGALFHCGLVIAFLSLFMPYSIVLKLAAVLAFVVSTLSVLAGLYRWRTGYIAARYFILAWALFLLSVVAYVAGKFGIIPQSAYTEHAMHFGAMFGSIVSAFALTDRVNGQRLSYMEAQKRALLMQQEAKEDLEKTVTERTQKLQEALTELEKANEQLQSISMLDGLTGIKNRRFFDEKIEREWGRA
ncbi:MAG: 7TM diverse intracellular signaling domain-containing protein, partial [Ketobacteraceae bacterium]|nr:7TM diverse intracellular signaling domain-containing protein [Ketobacteraceae bacterium]